MRFLVAASLIATVLGSPMLQTKESDISLDKRGKSIYLTIFDFEDFTGRQTRIEAHSE